MKLGEILCSFISMTADAVAVGFRAPDEDEARLIWVNPAYEALFGYSEKEALGQYVTVINDPDHYDSFVAQIVEQFGAGRDTALAETYCKSKSGRRFWTSLSVARFETEHGRFSFATYRDLSKLKAREDRAEKALAELDAAHSALEVSQARLIAAIEALPDPISIWDNDLKLVVSNGAFGERVLGQYRGPKTGLALKDVLQHSLEAGLVEGVDTPSHREAWLAESMRLMREGPAAHVNRFPDGKIFRTATHPSANGDLMVVSADVTEIENQRQTLERYSRELEIAHQEMKYQAFHDELTGLHNRRGLGFALDALQMRMEAEGGRLCALNIDLDRFKHINDTQGHGVGDALLKKVADILRDVTLADDALARMGGDEFMILRLCQDNKLSSDDLARDIVDRLSAPLIIQDKEVRIGASVGIATTDISAPDGLLVDSDVALYKAKSAGRNCFRRFEQADREEMERIKRVSDEVLCGLERGEFVPFYQPQVDARTLQVIGFEILARWQHPSDGVLLPHDFLGIAEELNVVERIDEAVFSIALRQMGGSDVGEMYPSLSFNVSSQRLASERLLRDALRARDYPGEISFELLETILLDDANPEIRMQLDALQDAGVHIEMDDFGTGHASIIALQQVAPRRLKIDRRLVAPLPHSAASIKLVSSIVSIAHALDIDVIAEGVETPDQARVLAQLGCDRLQGYLFGKPMAFDAALSLFAPQVETDHDPRAQA